MRTVVILISSLSLVFLSNSAPSDEFIDKVKMKEGFKIQYYYKGLPKVRAMKYLGNGILVAGSREDKVYMVIDTNRDFKVDIHRVLVDSMDWLVGVDVIEVVYTSR